LRELRKILQICEIIPYLFGPQWTGNWTEMNYPNLACRSLSILMTSGYDEALDGKMRRELVGLLFLLDDIDEGI
jgi:hypothetical protein